jgi:DNA-binding LacI/PurR family transcriptional regulator
MAISSVKIVVTAPFFGSAFQIALLDHFKKVIRPEQLSLRSATNELDKQHDTLKKILAENRPTILIAISMVPDPETVSLYKTNNVPIILIDGEAPGASTVTTDNFAGGTMAAEHLIMRGKKKIAIVNGRIHAVGNLAGNYCARLRLEGYKEALRRKGFSIPVGGSVEVANYSREDGLAVMPGLISAGVDAVFCAAADNTALGLLAAAKDRKIRVPEDIAIIGFDDLPVAQLSTPGLTTIKQPMKEIVEAAYKMVSSQQEEILRSPKKVLLKPELIVRQST